METLKLTIEGKLKWLRVLRGGPITALVYLWLYGRAVHRSVIDDFFGWDKSTTRKHLRVLEDHGLATQADEVWRLVQAGFQLAIEFRPVDADLEVPQGVGEIAPASEAAREKFSRENFSRPSIISINNNLDSLINNNNTSARISRAEKSHPTAHIAKITQALAAKQLGTSQDDVLPPELRHCVERLVKLGAPRRKAELAVAQSPFTAAVITEQISAWVQYRATPEGRTIKPSGFPYLIMARLISGDALAIKADESLNAYDGYLTDAEQGEL